MMTPLRLAAAAGVVCLLLPAAPAARASQRAERQIRAEEAARSRELVERTKAALARYRAIRDGKPDPEGSYTLEQAQLAWSLAAIESSQAELRRLEGSDAAADKAWRVFHQAALLTAQGVRDDLAGKGTQLPDGRETPPEERTPSEPRPETPPQTPKSDPDASARDGGPAQPDKPPSPREIADAVDPDRKVARPPALAADGEDEPGKDSGEALAQAGAGVGAALGRAGGAFSTDGLESAADLPAGAGGVRPGSPQVAAEGDSAAPAVPGARGAHTGNPADPRSRDDLLLAFDTGFRDSFTRRGFTVGPGPDGARTVLGPDGHPATDAQLQALAAGVRSDPAALAKRPDFFTAGSPAHFGELKRELGADPGRAEFRDIRATTGERDLVFSRSCSRALDGDCNEFVLEKSYAKDQFVAPESLDRLYARIKRLGEKARAAAAGGIPGPLQRKRLFGRLGNLLASLRGSASEGRAVPVPLQAGGIAVSGGRTAAGGASPALLGEPGARGGVLRAPPAGLTPPESGGPRRFFWFWPAAIAGLGLIAVGLRRSGR